MPSYTRDDGDKIRFKDYLCNQSITLKKYKLYIPHWRIFICTNLSGRRPTKDNERVYQRVIILMFILLLAYYFILVVMLQLHFVSYLHTKCFITVFCC